LLAGRIFPSVGLVQEEPLSKVVCVCLRDETKVSAFTERLIGFGDRLIPDNIQPASPIVSHIGGAITAIFNPNEALRRHGESVCLGLMVDPPADWWEPDGAVPDGSFAIFRSDGDRVQMVTDFIGSRTIWYLQTDEMFVASTSQRAIVALQGEFRANPLTAAWMLSSGTLGPGYGWDTRLHCLEGNAILTFDRGLWQVTIATEEVEFVPSDTDPEALQEQLHGTLKRVLHGLDFDPERWLLPLSGGYDSRAILMLLDDPKSVRCVTWGLRASLQNPRSDTHIAHRLAEHLALEHRFMETDLAVQESMERIFERFLVAGEGRVDHLAGYMDGFRIWKQLFDEGTLGVIRGDEGFGWVEVYSPFDARRSVDFLLLRDIAGLDTVCREPFTEQHIPSPLLRRSYETLPIWRDRLYHKYRLPTVLAALNDIKAAYVEIVNPMLSRSVLELVRKMPDELRSEKRLFKRLIESITPPVDFAVQSAIELPEDILRRPQVAQLLLDELSSQHAETYLPPALIRYLLEKIQVSAEGEAPKLTVNRFKARIKQVLPRSLVNATRRVLNQIDRAQKVPVNANVLAFRAFLILRMSKMLSEDAARFRG
jgi:asparagine synthetase B (glutamine-hydrolysing)